MSHSFQKREKGGTNVTDSLNVTGSPSFQENTGTALSSIVSSGQEIWKKPWTMNGISSKCWLDTRKRRKNSHQSVSGCFLFRHNPTVHQRRAQILGKIRFYHPQNWHFLPEKLWKMCCHTSRKTGEVFTQHSILPHVHFSVVCVVVAVEGVEMKN